MVVVPSWKFPSDGFRLEFRVMGVFDLIVKLILVELLAPAVSVTVTGTLYEPVTVGVPLTIPVLESSERLGGRGEVADHV